MIISFADKTTEEFWKHGQHKGMPPDIRQRAFRKLQLIDAAASLVFLRMPPGNMLEKLSGDREGQYSIRVNQRWRICFVWDGAHAHHVEFVDYH